MTELEDFRAEKDAFFRDDLRSPLTPGQRNGFGGLAYFPEEPGLAIHAELETRAVDRDEAIEMQNGGRTPRSGRPGPGRPQRRVQPVLRVQPGLVLPDPSR